MSFNQVALLTLYFDKLYVDICFFLCSFFSQTDMQSWEEQSQGAIYSVEYACRWEASQRLN